MDNIDWIKLGIFLFVLVFGIFLFSVLSGQLDSTGEVRKDHILPKIWKGMKNGFLFLFWFSLGAFLFYYSSKEIYEGYRLRNHSILVIGEIQSSDYFQDRRGSRKNRRTVTGYKVNVRFFDSGVEKIKVFEFKNNVNKGAKVDLYHVPGTNISSLEIDYKSGKIVWNFIRLALAIGLMIWGGLYGLKLFTGEKNNQSNE